MGTARVQKRIRIDAPIEHVFERLLDHEAMGEWPGIDRAKLVTAGAPTPNGLGAVRAVQARGITLLEEVVHYEAPVAYDYKITKGLPVDHLGQVRLEQDGESVELTWEVTMKSGFPFMAKMLVGMLGNGLPAALAYFKEDTERRHREQR